MCVRTIYLDHNATTPLDPSIRELLVSTFDDHWGNPSSIHHVGQRARSLLDDARERIASVFSCRPSELIFTSGATESANLAVFGAARALRDKGKHIITSAIEHHAVLHPCEYLANSEGFDLTILPVDSKGRVSVESLVSSFRDDTVLVSIMAANNEIGTIQPVAELGSACRDRGVIFHTDAVQWFGKLPFSNISDFNADLVSLCPHKFYGPKGAGLLYSRSPFNPSPFIFGGAHENERRAGTENLPAFLGMATAIELFVKTPVFSHSSISPLTELLISSLDSLNESIFLGDRDSSGRLFNTASFAFPGHDSISLLSSLDLDGICASGGSACSSGSVTPSHVVSALFPDSDISRSLVRFSLGNCSSFDDISSTISSISSHFCTS